jgi:hypothetical protein
MSSFSSAVDIGRHIFAGDPNPEVESMSKKIAEKKETLFFLLNIGILRLKYSRKSKIEAFE